ncbi:MULTISPECIES: hypothetical protein [Mesoflavibacter]|uniref:Uncharacterized protein n=1 Tax=Mesoflavibacter profundi TaxID=2708110 RepID=A0ABT4S1L1_9FLAO|nr:MULTISPECIES: hypothetical protein [Mesoflavibacter]MDA0177949.1 hypothetical protein [Mesoflavibacter profundi]QIJ88909.1 hypothetical protein C7H62_1100 [Mesoflavibacter sp. HG96]QIJ91637.1 hypothetical protein C7H56_1100 [Mesoflavibacter sp. HG37]
MDAIQDLLTKISVKTREIEEDYPELQKYLDEQRITLPKDSSSNTIDKQSLEDYLNSLQSLIDNYEKESQ